MNASGFLRFNARLGSRRGRYLFPLPAVAAFFFLNALLTAEVPSHRVEWDALLRVSPEALGLLLGMCLLIRAGTHFRPPIYAALTTAVILLRLFQSADRLVPMIFNRAFNLFMDTQRLPDLVFLFWQTRPAGWMLMGAAGLILAAAGLTWSVWRALKTLHHGLSDGHTSPPGIRLPTAAVSAAIFWALAAGPPPQFLAAPAMPRVIEEIHFILNLDDIRNRHLTAIRQATERAHHANSGLQRFQRASVFLMVVESYGMSAFSDPRHADAVLPAVRAAEAELRSAGFEMCSAFLTSPTFGGGSWLSHATLASGIRIDSQIGHDLLLASDLTPLAEYFNRAGYHTVRAMPGTLWPWPQGAFYRFGQTILAPAFGYRGPAFGFSPMPDQYVLDWIARRVIRDRSGPLFVEAILTGSHAAFDTQAPYLADWERIGDGAVFSGLPPVVFPVEWSDLSQASAAYGAAVVHVVAVLKEFIRRFLDGLELVIIVGDHQPAVELIGENQPWSVPVHVISRNPDVIAEFARRGYTPGLTPGQPLPHPGMETLFWDVIEGLSTPHLNDADRNAWNPPN